MLLGYNTNGMAHHSLFDAIRLLADIGYQSVAITVDHHALSPKDPVLPHEMRRLRALLDEVKMCSVIETGARYLLDVRTKHEPTLVSADPAERCRRVEFYKHAIRCAAELGSDCVSLWSGVVRDAAPRDVATDRLLDGLRRVLDYAAGQGVNVGFEPEPDMLIGSMQQFDQLLERINSPNLRLTLDVGHLHCQRELPVANYIRRWGRRIVNVHLEDMRAGSHEHLMFGEGEIKFPSVLTALAEIGYRGGLHVELSRHSHEAPDAAQRAYDFLHPILKRIASKATEPTKPEAKKSVARRSELRVAGRRGKAKEKDEG
jgi:sugar phosphate isomerase/epimerase